MPVCSFFLVFKFTAAAIVETAEHFIIFQTEDLDSNDQSFESTDEQVAESNTIQFGMPAFCTGQLQYHFHDGCMADGNAPIRIKESVLKNNSIKGFKHLKESLSDHVHSRSGLHLVSTLFNLAGAAAPSGK